MITLLALSIYALSGNALSTPAPEALPVPLLAFMLDAMALNIFMVWMFNHTHGSLIMPFLAHWSFNFIGSATGAYGVPALLWLITGLWWMIAAAIIALDWACITPRILRPHWR